MKLGEPPEDAIWLAPVADAHAGPAGCVPGLGGLTFPRGRVEGRSGGAGDITRPLPFDQTIYAVRRARVFAEMERQGGGVMLLPAAEEKTRNADNEFPFRQDSDYAWLVGLEEPQGGALLLARGGERRVVLFVRPKDRAKEIWTGFREGVEGATARWGADEAFTVAELDAKLPEYLENAPTLWWRLGAGRRRGTRAWRGSSRARHAAAAREGVAGGDCRAGEDPARAAAPQGAGGGRAAAEGGGDHRRGALRGDARREARAARVPGAGGARVRLPAARRERDELRDDCGGGRQLDGAPLPGGQAELRDGDVCLVDAGGEFDLYAGDVTRTWPVSGQFSKAQRDLYELVLVAQKEALAAVRPGATIEGIHEGAVKRLTEGLVTMGLLRGPAADRIAEGNALGKLKAGSPEEKAAPRGYRKYYMHRTSHWMGLDVHDVGDYVVDGKPRPLEPGMVLTIEPGLYVAPDDADAPAELRGVGIRIEDDVLVTEQGGENLTAAVPKEVEELEAVCTR